ALCQENHRPGPGNVSRDRQGRLQVVQEILEPPAVPSPSSRSPMAAVIEREYREPLIYQLLTQRLVTSCVVVVAVDNDHASGCWTFWLLRLVVEPRPVSGFEEARLAIHEVDAGRGAENRCVVDHGRYSSGLG